MIRKGMDFGEEEECRKDFFNLEAWPHFYPFVYS
jgi:hypothetical protein